MAALVEVVVKVIEGEDRVKATYRGNFGRLARIKAKYDPGNLFSVNQNIKPGATS